jgi:hypothetical protein
LAVQKIDAIKTPVLPMLDFMLANGDVGVKQLREMDPNIRGTVDRALKVRGLPVECHHASGEMVGYHTRVCSKEGLLVRSLAQMILSKDDKNDP